VQTIASDLTPRGSAELEESVAGDRGVDDPTPERAEAALKANLVARRATDLFEDAGVEPLSPAELRRLEKLRRQVGRLNGEVAGVLMRGMGPTPAGAVAVGKPGEGR
jgi:hypothetical protein